jgi:signal transduction histidine kinase
MNRFTEWSHQWVFYFMSGLFWGSAVLRSSFAYRGQPVVFRGILFLLSFLTIYVIGELTARKVSWFFQIYLLFQTTLIVLLLRMPYPSDYFAVLFAIISMQIFQRFRVGLGSIFIFLFALVTVIILTKTYGLSQAIALGGVYAVASLFTAVYALTSRHAQEAHLKNQILANEIETANQELQKFSDKTEKMAIARERHHLARDLHDSVTQTIFSMTLTTQSAVLLLDRDSDRVGEQLTRLNQLTNNAISEMQTLITELRPTQRTEVGLAAAIRRNLVERHLPEDLQIDLTGEGDQSLSPQEEQSLFRIVQEALNNIVKHSSASRATVHMHLAEPFWIEIADRGRGFDLQKARQSGQVGLESMEERAAEIGWILQISTGLGIGTRVRIEKSPSTER